MFDEAYTAEATITAANIELEKNWKEWKEKHDLDTKFILYYAFLNKPWLNIQRHWSIIYYTHGGM